MPIISNKGLCKVFSEVCLVQQQKIINRLFEISLWTVRLCYSFGLNNCSFLRALMFFLYISFNFKVN